MRPLLQCGLQGGWSDTQLRVPEPWLTSSELEVAAGAPRSACILGLQGKDLLLQLEEETLKLVEPQSQALLHAQPIVSIRVWGVGRDSGRWAQGLGSLGGGSPAARAGPPP